MPQVAAPGDYPVFVTVGRLPGVAFDQVAFASLVVSDAPTVSWVARDDSRGRRRHGRLHLRGRVRAGWVVSARPRTSPPSDAAFDSLTAHDDLITEVPIGDGTDLAMFATGYGDGAYGVYVGLDADGKPTRYVMDFAIVHLGWPWP